MKGLIWTRKDAMSFLGILMVSIWEFYSVSHKRQRQHQDVATIETI